MDSCCVKNIEYRRRGEIRLRKQEKEKVGKKQEKRRVVKGAGEEESRQTSTRRGE